MYKLWISTLAVVWVGLSAVTVAQAQDRATVQLRDGSKFEGRVEEMTGGELFVRVSQHDQRRVPVGSVALIDRVGGANGLPDTELREAAGSQHVLLLSNGSSLRGQLVAIRGGQGSANENEQRAYVFRVDGQERSFAPDQVSRVYMGQYPFASNTGSTAAKTENSAAGLDPGTVVPGAIRVPAAAGWVSTGMRVQRGEVISFSTTGEVQLSESGADRARSAGASRTAPLAPLPNAAAGALIGRVGNSQAFGIGNQTSVPMPFDGILYLAVNDDERSDNAGEFVVSMGRLRR